MSSIQEIKELAEELNLNTGGLMGSCGKFPGARNLDDLYMKAMIGAVTTRAQARQEVRHIPLTIPDTPKHIGVDRAELIRLQQDDEVVKMGETSMSENHAGRTSFFDKRDGIV